MAKREGKRRSRWQIVFTVILIVIIVVPVTFALLHRGFAGTDIAEADTDVWVTSADDRLAGRVNTQIHELDAATGATTSAFEVYQDAGEVYVHDDAVGSLVRLDPATGLAIETVSVPLGSDVAIRGGMLAVLERATGAVWVADTRNGLNFDSRTMQPVLELGPSAQVIVTEVGEVIAAAVGDQSIYRIGGVQMFPQRVPLGLELSEFEITAVGGEVAILDIAAQTVIFDDGRRMALAQNGIHIQEVSGPNDFVAVATASEIMLVPFREDAKTDTISAGGSGDASSDPTGVSRPVLYNNCHFGAWGSLATVVAGCPGQEDLVSPIDARLQGGELRFRTAGGEIALNNLRTGDTFLPLENMKLVDNWDEVLPHDRLPAEALEVPDDIVPLSETLDARTDVNRAPELEDDLAGVRPGQKVVVPVLANDRDPDGDVVRITDVQQVGAAVGTASGSVEVIDDGRSIVFTPDPGVWGSIAFTYRVSDGRTGGTAEAIARIRIIDDGTNTPPEQMTPANVRLEQGARGSVDALEGWVDAEGDQTHLVAADGDEGLDVRYTPAGRVTVTGDAEPGVHTVSIVASDGFEQRAGEVQVEVAAPGTLVPETAADFATGTTDAPVTVDVTANDPGTGGGPPTLASATESQGREGVSFDAAEGTVSLDVSTAGIYSIIYTVQSGAQTAKGIVRIDVQDPATLGDTEPVAVPDAVHLQGMQPGTVDLTANDTGDRSRVLTVVGLDDLGAAEQAGIRIELIDHAIVRATPTRPLADPVELSYTLSDGETTDRGSIVVTTGGAIEKPRPPVAENDDVTVRAGDIAVVAPLENDTHPDRLDMHLDPELVSDEFGDGIVDVDGEVIRLQAPTTPGTHTLTYRAVDALGGATRGDVTVTVTAEDATTNRPPEPEGVDARAVAGTPVRIDLPLANIDPDGDFVTVDSVPDAELGSIVDVDATGFTYVPSADALGTETIPVAVADAYGASAFLPLRVGVAAAPVAPAAPVAVDDHVTVPPGTPFSVQVLENDTDPGGLTFGLDPDVPRNDVGASAEVDGEALVVTPPEGATDFSVPYTVVNAAGVTSTAFVHVAVRADAGVADPRAANHVVSQAALRQTTIVDVPVLEGATHSTGRVGELIVEIVDEAAPASIEDNVLRVEAGDERLVVPYRVTSPVTGESAVGFVVVPPVPRV